MTGTSRSSETNSWLDGLAIFASSLCLVHCLGLPLIVALLPGLGLLGDHGETIHWLLLSIAAPLAWWALSAGRARAGPWPRSVGIVGLLLMTAALVLFGDTSAERWLTTAGVLLLAGAHIANWRASRSACAA